MYINFAEPRAMAAGESMLAVDDHPVVREGPKALLSRAGFCVAAEAQTGEKAMVQTAAYI